MGSVALIASMSIRKSQRAAESRVAATEIRPPLGTEPRAVVTICLVGTEHALLCVCDRESVLHRPGLCSRFPASRAPRLHCALPPLRSLIIAINPGGLSPFVCWHSFFFLSLEFSALFLPSLFFFVCLAVALGGCVVIFLVFMLSPDLIKILLLHWARQICWPHQVFPLLSS